MPSEILPSTSSWANLRRCALLLNGIYLRVDSAADRALRAARSKVVGLSRPQSAEPDQHLVQLEFPAVQPLEQAAAAERIAYRDHRARKLLNLYERQRLHAGSTAVRHGPRLRSACCAKRVKSGYALHGFRIQIANLVKELCSEDWISPVEGSFQYQTAACGLHSVAPLPGWLCRR